MKKIVSLFIFIGSLLFASILPQNFGKCIELGYFTQNNPPIPLNDYMKVINKYSCGNKIIYIGIEERMPGILKIDTNADKKNFLLKHLTFKGYKTAVYIDKNLQKGVIAIKLTDKYSLKVLFYGTDYNSILNLLNNLNLNKIKKQSS